MARGQNAKPGDTRTSANGYHYTRTKDEWRLTHHLIAEEKVLGRKLVKGERVSFKDGDKTNLTPDNVRIEKMGQGSLRRRAGQLEARIQELQAELHEVQQAILEESSKP